MSEAVKPYDQLGLPSNVVTRIDLSRMVIEAERVDNDMTSAAVRADAGGEAGSVPAMSPQLSDFLVLNDLSMSQNGQERTELIKQLRLLKDKAPVFHMTFAVPADGESLQHLAFWTRSSVHPQSIIEVGLQPALVAGVYLRTPNHVHDLSVRGLLAARHDVLVQELEGLRGTK